MKSTKRSSNRRRRHSNGQLKPLHTRLTPAEANERAITVAARRTVADQLNRQMSQIVGIVNSHSALLRRSFMGRMKWAFLGK